jgi:Protein of unknown function (DUF3489)
MTTKLSDTQAVILSAAAQRDDGAVLPLPETLRLKGGAVAKVLGSLEAKGLIERQGAPRGDDPPLLRITRAGLAAIGVEPEGEETQVVAPVATEADTGATPAEAGAQAVGAPAPATEADSAAKPARRRTKSKAKLAKSDKTAAADKPTPRAGTKQALMIELLRRPEGATVEQIAAATGWQKHTIRGAISGALKKKLGLTVEATRTREVGPDKSGAKGSSTVYRITGSSPSTS